MSSLSTSEFPLNVLHGATTAPPTIKKNVAGPTIARLQETTFSEPSKGNAGLTYIGNHMIFVVVFILMTLGLYYMVGKKSTTYFLLVVLVGQLVIPGGTGAGITELVKYFSK